MTIPDLDTLTNERDELQARIAHADERRKKAQAEIQSARADVERHEARLGKVEDAIAHLEAAEAAVKWSAE